VRTVDGDQDDEDARLGRQRRHDSDRRNLRDMAVEGQLGIRVETHLHQLSDLEVVDVRLAHARPNPHRLGIDDVDDRLAGAHFFPLLHFRHVVGLPDRTQHRHAAERRDDGHALGVRFGLAHRVLGAVAANLEDLEVGFRRRALESVGRLQLVQRRDGLFDREVVFLGLNARYELVLVGLEAGTRQGALC